MPSMTPEWLLHKAIYLRGGGGVRGDGASP